MLTIGRFVRAESSKNCSTFSRSVATVSSHELHQLVSLEIEIC